MFLQNTKAMPGLFGLNPVKPAPTGPQTQPTFMQRPPVVTPQAPPVGGVEGAFNEQLDAQQPKPRYGKMARSLLEQKFNRQIPSGASRGGAIATGIGGILDNAVDGWATKRGFEG